MRCFPGNFLPEAIFLLHIRMWSNRKNRSCCRTSGIIFPKPSHHRKPTASHWRWCIILTTNTWKGKMFLQRTDSFVSKKYFSNNFHDKKNSCIKYLCKITSWLFTIMKNELLTIYMKKFANHVDYGIPLPIRMWKYVCNNANVNFNINQKPIVMAKKRKKAKKAKKKKATKKKATRKTKRRKR